MTKSVNLYQEDPCAIIIGAIRHGFEVRPHNHKASVVWKLNVDSDPLRLLLMVSDKIFD